MNTNYKYKYLKYKKKYMEYKNYILNGGSTFDENEKLYENKDDNEDEYDNENEYNNKDDNEAKDDNKYDNEAKDDNEDNLNDDIIFNTDYANCKRIINTISPTIHPTKKMLLDWDLIKYNIIKNYIRLCKTTYNDLIKNIDIIDIINSKYPDLMTNIITSIQKLICAINNNIFKDKDKLLIIEPITITMLETLCIDITQNFKIIDTIIDDTNKSFENNNI